MLFHGTQLSLTHLDQMHVKSLKFNNAWLIDPESSMKKTRAHIF